MAILGAILFILGIVLFVLSFVYLAENDSILGFILIMITGIGVTISGSIFMTNMSKRVKEYNVVYSETYTSDRSDHGHLHEFIIEDENGSCTKIIITEDEAKLYYRNDKFFISDNELNKLKGE